jgi:uroporphyrinogen-III synthase
MKLLIIRPQPGNDASAARARTAGFDPVQLPFFEVRARDWQAVDPGDYDALLITSSNAVRHTGAQLGALSALPVHAVGRVSAEAAIAAGFDIASSGLHGMAEALVAAQAAGHQRLLWLAGEDRIAIETPKAMHIEERIVYASEAVMLSDAAKAVIESCPLVALHSPRAAQSFAAYVDANGLHRKAFVLAAFSPAIAAAAGEGWGGISAAAHPEDAALLSAAAELVRLGENIGAKGDKG